MKIIAYTYEADAHCIGCASKRFGLSPAAASILEMATDKEGNEVHPIFSTDEQIEPLYCGDCHQPIVLTLNQKGKHSIMVNEVEVAINLEDRSGGRPGQRSVGLAVHTVSETDLDEGSAGGPCDGYTFTLAGKTYKIGQHDYKTNDGQVTCSAEVYEVAV